MWIPDRDQEHFLRWYSVRRPPAIAGDPSPILDWKESLEQKTAAYSSTLTWKVLWTEEPDGLQFMGSQRVEHNCTKSPALPEELLIEQKKSMCLIT